MMPQQSVAAGVGAPAAGTTPGGTRGQITIVSETALGTNRRGRRIYRVWSCQSQLGPLQGANEKRNKWTF